MLKARFENNGELLKILKTVENILNSSMAGEKFIKLSNEKNKLQLTAINPSMRLQYLMDVDDIQGDSALYDYKKLIALLNVIKGTVTIENGSIKSSKCAYKIPSEEAKNYPNDVLPGIAEHTKINTQKFITALENASLAIDKISSGVMSGVFIGENKLVGCDSKRVSVECIETDENIQNITLSKDIVKEIVRLPFEDEIIIAPFGERVIIQDEKIRLACVRLADKYPVVEKVLPKDIKTIIKLKNKDLYEALVMVAPVIDEASKTCCLDYNEKKMQIYVDNGAESAKTSIDIESNGSAKVKFNIQFLLDMIKANGEDITIKTYSDSIGYMFSSSTDSFQYIMPLIN